MQNIPKAVKIIGTLIVIGGIAASIAFMVATRGKTRVELVPLPEDSTITIDGQPAKAGGQYITTGKHTITAARQHFTTTTIHINTDDADFERTIYLTPGADSDEAIAWLAKHPEVSQAREGVIGSQMEKKSRELTEKYPLMAELPYKTLDWDIGYSFDDKDEIIYTITLYPVATTPGTDLYKQQLYDFRTGALSYLQAKGVDIQKAKITVTPDPDKL